MRNICYKFFSAILVLLSVAIVGGHVARAATLDKPIYVENLSSGLVGWWTFEGNTLTPNVVDSSGQGNSGFLVNFTSTTTSVGKIGQALSFTGSSNQYVNLSQPSSLNVAAEFTVSLWVNPKSFTNYQDPISKCGTFCQFGILIPSTGVWHGQNTSGTDVISNYTLSLNQWQMLTIVWNGATMYTYTNGAFNTSAAGSVTSQAVNTYIGADVTNGRYFNGSIDDVRIFNRALSASEISQLYTLGAGKTRGVSFKGGGNLSNNLVGWWTFDGPDTTSTTTIIDRSGQAHNGTTAFVGFITATSSTWRTVGKGTWTAPTNVGYVIAQAWGAGGAGGGTNANGAGGSGGGGGSFAEIDYYQVTPGTNYSFYVAKAGAAVLAAKGGNGEDSSFISSTTLLAKGGSGGGLDGGTAGAAQAGSVGTVVFTGGTGGTGATSTASGGGGGGAGTLGNGGNASGTNNVTGGTGASVGGGNGGNGGASSNAVTGGTGNNFGGGGGGSKEKNTSGSSAAGGSGAQGEVVITGFYGTSAAFVPGVSGQALKFDGNLSSVSVGTGPTSVSTVSFWFKASTSTTQSILDLDGGTHTVAIASNTVAGNGFATPTIYVDGTSGSTVSDTNWHMITITTATPINASNFNIGLVGAQHCGCTIDDVRLYSTVLASGDVRALYNIGGGTHVAVSRTGNSRVTSNLGAWYTMDGPNMLKNVADSAGTFNGSLIKGTGGNTSTTTAPGKMGQAIVLDGVDDYINVGSGPSGVQTVSFWIKAATSTTQKILDLDNGTHTITSSSGTVSAGGFASPTLYVDGQSGSTIDTGWHMVTVTTATPVNATALTIGKASSGVCGCTLDDVRFYTTPLSANDVYKLYNLGK